MRKQPVILRDISDPASFRRQSRQVTFAERKSTSFGSIQTRQQPQCERLSRSRRAQNCETPSVRRPTDIEVERTEVAMKFEAQSASRTGSRGYCRHSFRIRTTAHQLFRWTKSNVRMPGPRTGANSTKSKNRNCGC